MLSYSFLHLCSLSEFSRSRPSDKNRYEQLLSSMAKQGHPMGKFMWGRFFKKGALSFVRQLYNHHLSVNSFTSYHEQNRLFWCLAALFLFFSLYKVEHS